MTYRVIVTPTADNEAMEAIRWYAEQSPIARRLIDDYVHATRCRGNYQLGGLWMVRPAASVTVAGN